MIMNRRFIGIHSITTLVMILTRISSGNTQRELGVKHNEFCKARPTLVALDSPQYRYLPLFVTLYRCGGSASTFQPSVRVCAPKTTEEVKIMVVRTDGSINGLPEPIVEKNHTSCHHVCAENGDKCDPKYQFWETENCKCGCKYPNGPTEECAAGFRWNQGECKCECKQGEVAWKCVLKNKIYDGEKCGCKCHKDVIDKCKRRNKDLDEDNCQCVDRPLAVGQGVRQGEPCISIPLLVGLMAAELVLLLVLLEVYLYRKGFGLIFFLRKGTTGPQLGAEKDNQPTSPTAHHVKTTYL